MSAYGMRGLVGQAKEGDGWGYWCEMHGIRAEVHYYPDTLVTDPHGGVSGGVGVLRKMQRELVFGTLGGGCYTAWRAAERGRRGEWYNDW